MSSYKKIISIFSLTLIIAILLPGRLSAQKNDTAALKRKLIISVGYGDPAILYVDNWINNNFKMNGVPKIIPHTNPIYAKMEFRVFRHLGIGIDVSYDDYEDEQIPASTTNYETVYKGHTLLAALRLNRHIHLVHKKLDLYFGVGVGYQIQSISNIIVNQSLPKSGSNDLAFELTFGARYYFTKRVGFYAEVGAAKSIVQGGLAIRL